MGLEFEVAGDLVTAGLVAREVEGQAGDTSAHAHAAPCANCGTPVTGHYCGHCGQKGHLHKSVLHLGEELLHGLFHFDTKGWRTLPMLAFRPGQLTRRYVDGQRTRFVSPLALFLFMMFLMFFVFSLTMGGTNVSLDGANKGQSFESKMAEKIATQKEFIAEEEQVLKEADAGSRAAERARKRLDQAQKKLTGYENALAAGDKVTGKDGKVDSDGVLAQIAKETNIDIDSGKEDQSKTVQWMKKGLKHAVENPELAKYKLKNAAYKYSFLLVPISLPFLWLMFFWRRGITMYDHAVFSLYSLSFMSLLFITVAVLAYYGFEGTAGCLFAFVPPVHMYFQLRDTYKLGRFGALWRTCWLLFMTVLVLSLYALVVLALSAS